MFLRVQSVKQLHSTFLLVDSLSEYRKLFGNNIFLALVLPLGSPKILWFLVLYIWNFIFSVGKLGSSFITNTLKLPSNRPWCGSICIYLRFFFFKCGWFLKSLLNLLQYCFCFRFWFFSCKACENLSSSPGIKPAPPALEGEILTTGPLEKSLFSCILMDIWWLLSVLINFTESFIFKWYSPFCLFVLEFWLLVIGPPGLIWF